MLLLLLGSNLDTSATVEVALARLGELGAVRALSPVRRMRARSGTGPDYFNVLATLASALDEAVLEPRLKAIEADLGRERGAARVAIDIDVLASRRAAGWYPGAAARRKREAEQTPARELLAEAGIVLLDAPTAPP
ncbi:2-amino-4-hydroxy-6-hydroxymethyldihydropteridine diphosphokinase [Coralloluteibacterium stylophorae]|uniref:2-amino-4-hydroxy-6-hydroxymethyldihydropteridine diphosphokinase n=1 Tax=Coralloluteibacterium stylophorae TaxID=1776034 RepID=A0A8J7VUH1_9GAMM|nr:2-amino-4-hydroxy-6-hydroxymethyldihydropteridine diphosphokinase [Coralloluteibacterium stylophorae]MBS7458050.1 2-amino-4-hydroxy-6-hydroxymethyldihydropteridine diphosphokinase [Coralloluteibacterium stylophorae]